MKESSKDTSELIATLLIIIGFMGIQSSAFALMIDAGAEGSVTAREEVYTDLKTGTEVEMTTAGQEASGDAALSAMIEASVLTDELKAKIGDVGNAVAPLMQTKADVVAYATIVAEEDDAVEDIRLGSNELTVAFTERGKLFWVIPATITSNAKVTTSGSVVVDRPWYSVFFSRSNTTDLESEIKTALGSNSEASIRAFAANATAADQAELVRKVVKSIEAAAAVEAASNTSASMDL